MPGALETFSSSIKDAEELLAHFNAINVLPPPPNAEVLKRAGLIMACTAWETYVEDRVQEAVQQRLGEGNDSFQNKFLLRHLQTTLKQFHNPSAEKTCKLFLDFLGVDVSAGWQWNNYDSARARLELDTLIKNRGEAVHRSKALNAGTPAAHLVRKDELEKAIRFLKSMVAATEAATKL
ncbi:HEPN domain-containing protein [Comamonas sediminis]|uniref:HEPN domain-containing protein n=1 Tax=Comamonas sediminis TaxID=1783360 RepID=A0ABV4B229_9BURK